jgi:hypothetical protein
MPLFFVLLPPIVIFFTIGCVVFMLFSAIPAMRRFALGSALWLAAWGVMSPGIILVNALGLGVLSQIHAHENLPVNQPLLHHLKTVAVANAAVFSGVATLITLCHGFLMRRITLALFRFYLSAMALGVGFLGCLLALLAVDALRPNPSLASFVGSALLAGTVACMVTSVCYRHPTDFRSTRPTRLQPVSESEYATIAISGTAKNE